MKNDDFYRKAAILIMCLMFLYAGWMIVRAECRPRQPMFKPEVKADIDHRVRNAEGEILMFGWKDGKLKWVKEGGNP